MSYRELECCVACGSDRLRQTLDLGAQALANAFEPVPTRPQRYPLVLNQCELCGHLQLSISVSPELLFTDYIYRSGTTDTLKAYFESFAKTITERYGVGRVLDIACNDGSQLDAFAALGWDTFGVDPATNLAGFNRHPKRVSFFDESCSDLGRFDVIVAQNVLAHTPDPDVILSVAAELAPVIYVQTSQARMLERGEFDTIYHEHVSFYSPHSMAQLALRSGWHLASSTIVPIHGDSFVFQLTKNQSGNTAPMRWLVEDVEHFAFEARRIIDELRVVFDQTDYCVGYGAAAKAMTLLQAVGAGPVYIVDDAIQKQNTYSPGLNIPVLASEVLAYEQAPLKLVPLAWNYHDEIIERVRRVYSGELESLRYFPTVAWS